jgi:hypothetical protein
MMNLLEAWSAAPAVDAVQSILPDGRRDLICWQRHGFAPRWFVSPLQDRPHAAMMRVGDRLDGFRLRPGVVIDAALLQGVWQNAPDPAEILQNLNDHTRLADNTDDALRCLAQARSTLGAARDLGVSPRAFAHAPKLRAQMGAVGYD